MSSSKATTLFISHSSLDGEIVEEFVERLRGAGYEDIIYDTEPDAGIQVGADWEQWIYRQVRRSTGLIFLASPSSIASKWCIAELAIANSVATPIFAAVVESSGDYPEFMRRFQRVDLTADFDSEFERLIRGLMKGGQLPEQSYRFDEARSPYPGLSGFRSEDSAIFFGRQNEISELAGLIGERSGGLAVMVSGPSGVGKSSLVNAGLLPTLTGGHERWLVVPPILPTAELLASATESFASVGVDIDLRDESLDHLALGTAISSARRASDADATLIVVDQAEQLLLSVAPNQRQRLLDSLRGAIDIAGSCLVLTIRSEYLSHEFAWQLAELSERHYPVGPLNRTQMRDVITEPARRSGLRIDPDLVEEILDDTRRGDALPLLAFTLSELWVARKDDSLTRDSYLAIGGVEGALKRKADNALALATDSRHGSVDTAQVLAVLTTLAQLEGEHDEPTSIGISLRDEVRQIIQPFIDSRLVVTDLEGTSAVCRVAHEAVLRQWQPLRTAIERERDWVRLRREVRLLAQSWSDRPDPDALLYGTRLRDVENAYRSLVPDQVVSGYLGASRSADRRRRNTRRTQFAAMAFLGVAAIAGVFAFLARMEATREATRNQALGLAVESSRLRTSQLDQALLLALEATHIDDTPETRGALLDALNEAPGPLLFVDREQHDATTASLTAADEFLGATASDELVLIEPLTGEEKVSRDHAGLTVDALEVQPGTSQAIISGVIDSNPVLVTWDAAAGELVVQQHLEAAAGLLSISAAGHLAWVDNNDDVWWWDRMASPRRLGSDSSIVRIAIGVDGACVAVASRSHIRVLPATERCPFSAEQLDIGLSALTASQSDFTLVFASEGGDLMLWEAGQEPTRLATHGPGVRALQITPDGTEVVSGGIDGTIRFWTTATVDVESRPALRGHADAVRRIRFGGSGDNLVSADDSGQAIVWTSLNERHRFVTRMSVPEQVGSRLRLMKANNGDVFLVGSGGVAQWVDGAFEVVLEGPVPRLTAIGGSDSTVVVGSNGDSLASWALDSSDRADELPRVEDAVAIGIVGESDRFVVLDAQGQLCFAALGDATAECDLLRSFSKPTETQSAPEDQSSEACSIGNTEGASLAVSPDGELVAIGGVGGRLMVVDGVDQSVVGCWLGDFRGGNQINDIEWLTDSGSSMIATAHAGNAIAVLEISSVGVSLVRVLQAHTDSVLDIAVVDETTLVSAAEDGRVVLWDWQTGISVGEGFAYQEVTSSQPEVRVTSVAPVDNGLLSIQGEMVLLWTTDMASWREAVCDTVNRSLTEIERQRYRLGEEAGSRCS